MRWLSPLRVSESIVSAALIICFSFAYFGELLGIAGIIGAFAAGIAISQTNYKHEVEKKVANRLRYVRSSILRKYRYEYYI